MPAIAAQTALPRRARTRVPRSRGASHTRPQYLNWPLLAVFVLVVALLGLAVPEHLLPAVLLACVNLLLLGVAIVYCLWERTLQGLIPAMFLTWLGVAWPLASVYFALAAPEASYVTLAGQRQFLFGNWRLQVATLVFTAIYLGVVTVFRRRYAAWHNPPAAAPLDRRAATVALAIAMAAIALNAVSKLRPFPVALQYLADGGYLYLHGLTLMVGVLFTRLTFRVRVATIVFLAVAAAFYSIGNARGMAALPIALFLIGLFFSDLKPRWKMWMLGAALVCFPIALVVTNTTRVVTKTIGFQDLDARVDALGEWHAVLSQTPVLTSTFGRLFFTGGHTIVTMSPEHYPYVPFSARRYLGEFFMRMLPRRYSGELYYSEPPNRLLGNYGFHITEENSVPLSMLGALYMLGGFVPLALGAAGIAVFHNAVGRALYQTGRRSRYFELFLFSLMASEILWGQNRDPISHVRAIVWSAAAAGLLYLCVLRPFLRLPTPAARRPLRLQRAALRPT
jgi:hypothetical protein